jgi:biotin operon repressor
MLKRSQLIDQLFVQKYTRMLELIREADRAHAVATLTLMRVLGISERIVRGWIEYARSQGMPIAKGPAGGYYFAENWQEFEETFRKNCHQALTTLHTMSILRRNLAHQGQLNIFDTQTEFDELLELAEHLNLPSDKAA